jgi:hypothetical protein
MKNILNRLINHEMLTAAEAKRSWSISLMAVITQVKSAFFDRLHDAQHQH